MQITTIGAKEDSKENMKIPGIQTQAPEIFVSPSSVETVFA